MLKFVEVVHQLELAATITDEDDYMRGVNANPLNRMRRLKRTASETAVMRGATALPQLSAQALYLPWLHLLWLYLPWLY